ncbi:gibberellin 2-beta-dioxygenase 8-like isoform X2 [Andrographis paniculata]|uniref:gibberellin 2-beta-dioxygenase 8-like isoform X2 n=1 Tax=Andrographis paniculata TaxID=175694 RepID=UPI0021E872BD|nr:gibberellin 2-beta-dioxygenase 8-like isoform X2 [Andrographis paniculata]
MRTINWFFMELSTGSSEGAFAVERKTTMMPLQPVGIMDELSPDPPFETQYKKLFDMAEANLEQKHKGFPVLEEWCDLPLIDLNELNLGDPDKQQACKKLISTASQECGFFQVINHGISSDVLEVMRREQVKLLKKPFLEKIRSKDLNLGIYQWGTPPANCLEHLSWSESFHIPLSNLELGSAAPARHSLMSAMAQFAAAMSELAQAVAEILAEEIGRPTALFKQTCVAARCYIRLNRYPPCPAAYPKMLGIIPHTDSAFLTVVHQDSIGGLQMVNNGRWIAVKPNPSALIVNIGDLFQAWSNDVYRSVEHRVVANVEKERYSSAYFLCPCQDTVIESGVYRSFTFEDYRRQVQEDVKIYGYKTGLSRFLIARPGPGPGQSIDSLHE